MKIENFTQATLVLARKVYGTTDEMKSESIALIANSLHGMDEADMCDWIATGEWHGDETIAGVQAEIDALVSAE